MRFFVWPFVYALLTLLSASAETGTLQILHGTVNVILANPNGMIIMTDSMLSDGQHQERIWREAVSN